jgi:3-methyladenine DNA glycosylase/8-oxoguanine DNA glycosylase
VPISLPVDDEANELLSRNALALLIAMLLDQQVPLERAFPAPRDLVRRLGHEPGAGELADFAPDALAARPFGPGGRVSPGRRVARTRWPGRGCSRPEGRAGGAAG